MRRVRPLLGTFVEVGIADEEVERLGESVSRDATQSAFTAIEQIQTLMSFHSATSELTRLNRHPFEWVPLSAATLRVLRLARGLMLRSDHLFNCTCGGALVASGRLPNPRDDGDFLDVGTANDLEISATAARLKRPVLITLDGIAKGFAVDVAIHCLQKNGVQSAWVNAGGDLRVIGSVRLPVVFRVSSGLTPPIQVANCALASSQISARFDARFPSLIVGVPQKQGDLDAALVTVTAKRAWKADALTKVIACCMPDRREGMAAKCRATCFAVAT